MKRIYSTDLTDAQYQSIKKILQIHGKRKWELHLLFNAIFYVVKTGVQWRMLPANFPPWQTVYWYFKKWEKDGSWELIHHELYLKAREKQKRKESPSAAIIDSQTVNTDFVGGIRGFDAGKKKVGRKRHIMVDTLGLLMIIVVHRANIQDRDGARFVFNRLFKDLFAFNRIKIFFADGGYAGALVIWVEERFKALGAKLSIVKRSDKVQGFKILPKRWIVERTFAWLGFQRRLSKDYERKPTTSETFIKIAMIRLMLNRIQKSA